MSMSGHRELQIFSLRSLSNLIIRKRVFKSLSWKEHILKIRFQENVKV